MHLHSVAYEAIMGMFKQSEIISRDTGLWALSGACWRRRAHALQFNWLGVTWCRELRCEVYSFHLRLIRPYVERVFLLRKARLTCAQGRWCDAADKWPAQACFVIWLNDGVLCAQRFFGTAVGKGRQAAKTEIERLKLGELTCEQGINEVAKMCAPPCTACSLPMSRSCPSRNVPRPVGIYFHNLPYLLLLP